MVAGNKCLALFLTGYFFLFMHEKLANLFVTILILSAPRIRPLITSWTLHMKESAHTSDNEGSYEGQGIPADRRG